MSAIPLAYPGVLEELARHMAAASKHNPRRLSRGANPTRVVKPSSANNSPGVMPTARRRITNDAMLRRPAQLVDPLRPAAPRPVSWHPGSAVPLMPSFPQPSAVPTAYDFDLLSTLAHYPPTPAAYSGQASPCDTYSPLSLPFSTMQQPSPPALSLGHWAPAAAPMPAPAMDAHPSLVPCYPSYPAAAMASPVKYAEPVTPGQLVMMQPGWKFEASHHRAPVWPMQPEAMAAAPHLPHTPVDAPPVQFFQPQAAPPVTATPETDSVPALEEDTEEDDDDEVLVGMGLYGSPEQESRSGPVHSSNGWLLAGRASGEPTGRGLKLEETWQPPEHPGDEDE